MHFVISEPNKVDQPPLRVRPGQHRTGTIARSENVYMHCWIPRLQCPDAANTKAPDLYTALIATAKRFEKVIDPSNRPRDATPANSSIYPCVQTPKFGPSTLPEVSEFYQNSKIPSQVVGRVDGKKQLFP